MPWVPIKTKDRFPCLVAPAVWAGLPSAVPKAVAMSSPEVAELQRRIAELESLLLQAQKLTTVGELASSITHEFNNVLTTVINYARLGLRNSDQASRDKAFEKILAAGQRASRITTGLLSYARRGTTRREATDLAVLTRDVLVLVEKELEQARVRLELRLPEQPVCSEINAGQLQQVLLNLVVNARQAMPQGGTLTLVLAAEPKRGVLILQVQDTGTGIAPEHLSKLFQPFFTTKRAEGNGQGGNGLGLSMCREVVEAHRGRIVCQSELGKGTRFTIELPLADPHAAQVAISPATAVLQKRARGSVQRAG